MIKITLLILNIYSENTVYFLKDINALLVFQEECVLCPFDRVGLERDLVAMLIRATKMFF